MDREQLFELIAEQKTAFLGSVNHEGYPVIRAMLAPRVIDGNVMYFSTNTSSEKVKQFRDDQKACVYFYKRGRFKYQGVSILGEVEVYIDQASKDLIWRFGDKLFYKKGVTDPDYCVLKFTARSAEYYCDFKVQKFEF